MARKDLSRTVIEGGRSRGNKWERRRSHGVERAKTREWLDLVSQDLDEADASAPIPIKFVYKGFRDKLGPAQRWLASQVDRPWSKVYSDLRSRFDARTVAGRHIVEDHMLGMVRRHPVGYRYFRQFELYVDDHGILKKPKPHGVTHQTMRRAAIAWFAGRVCARTYRGWWWFRYDMVGACYQSCKKLHVTDDKGVRYHRRDPIPLAAMTRAEVRYLDRLADEFRNGYVIASPWPAR